ncbi:hypothetical protein MNBD_GAMMA12-2592 [hydrothermal vent metagenome]|uniref:Uncharacterized protein n=1 Tax=hydrothermal vent metagenome TaxID=652676 RepID=A0A3B0YMN8_9ZZZZ
MRNSDFTRHTICLTTLEKRFVSFIYVLAAHYLSEFSGAYLGRSIQSVLEISTFNLGLIGSSDLIRKYSL